MEAKNVDLAFLSKTIEKLGYDSANIHAGDSFEESGLDSYGIVDLILELETQCSIVIEDNRILQLHTFQDILDAVHTVVNG